MPESIHPDTKLGSVHLTVSDLGRSLDFYEQALGFQRHSQANGTAHLGAGGPDLLMLSERPGARQVRGTSGLYHFALLVPSRLELARSLRHIVETGTPVQGFADHLVSEAIYLADPDGNGIEIYRDRPRGEWMWDARGKLQMATDPLDVEGVLGELEGQDAYWAGLDPSTSIGHMHLHVAHIDQAEAFYTGVLGFDLVLRYGAAASFTSAGGYHHHVGFNTWAGVGVPPPPADAAGLRWFQVLLPDRAALDWVANRVRNAGLPLEARENCLLVRDPSQNGVMLTAGEG